MTNEGPKRAGKAKWAGRRRPMTRKSGFSARFPVKLEIVQVDGVHLASGREMRFTFHLPSVEEGDRVGFGGWYYRSDRVEAAIVGAPARHVLTSHAGPDWNKFGSQWVIEATPTLPIEFRLRAKAATNVAVHALQCGIVEHEYLTTARAELLTNMWSFAPEGNFYLGSATGRVTLESDQELVRAHAVSSLYLKSCNRCGRSLPINVHNQRAHLSFTNHCVADHCRPCKHSSFGRIHERNGDDVHELEYGFQLECRFCKKFEVNAAHNPQRTSAQMKEDAQRRRSFELLLEHLYERSGQLHYRHRAGTELTNDVFLRFDCRCFKCRTPLATHSDMHLDHTRPLALLWPLDETATSLCATCNSSKRDRPPVDFYTPVELHELSDITDIPLTELQDPSPNLKALEYLSSRAEWFFDEFLSLPELQEVKDGKKAGDLLLKALHKVIQSVPDGPSSTIAGLCRDVERRIK